MKRTGQWIDAGGGEAAAAPVTGTKRKVAPRFARVMVSEPSTPPASMLLRLVLSNGRHAELQVAGMRQLAELIGVIERAT